MVVVEHATGKPRNKYALGLLVCVVHGWCSQVGVIRITFEYHLTSITRGRVGVKRGVALDVQSGVITQVHSTCGQDIFVAKLFSRLHGLQRHDPSLDPAIYSTNTTVRASLEQYSMGPSNGFERGFLALVGCSEHTSFILELKR